MALYSSILAWKIPWTEEPGGLQSMGPQRVRHSRETEHRVYNPFYIYIYIYVTFCLSIRPLKDTWLLPPSGYCE